MSVANHARRQGSQVSGHAYVRGEFVPLSDATIDILDRGFVRSDATYDVVHLWKGKFFRLDDYIERFFSSMRRLRMQPNETFDEVKSIIVECTARSGLRDAYIQMTCTRGVPPAGTRDPRLSENRLSVFVQPFVWISNPEQQQTGLRIIVADTLRIPSEALDQRIKNFHWLDLTQGLFEAYDKGADVAVHPSIHGGLTEGAGFNIFSLQDQVLSTPAFGMFEGMTRRTVIEIAPAHGLEIRIGNVSADDLAKADEIFATSTAGGIMPVTVLNGAPVGTGQPGPTTLALRKAYWDLHDDPAYATPLNLSR